MESWGIPVLTGKVSLGFTQHCYSLEATHQERAKPLQEAASKSKLVKLLQQEAVVHLTEGLRRIHIDHVHLFSVV